MKNSTQNHKENIRKRKWVNYLIYLLIALIASAVIIVAFKFTVTDDKEVAEEEIKKTIEEFANKSMNIGHELTTKEVYDENYNFNARLESCKSSLEYMTIGSRRRADVCKRAASLIGSPFSAEANSSFLESLEVTSIEIDDNKQSADVRISLEITSQSARAVPSDGGRIFIQIFKTKEPLKFDNLKLRLVKKEDKWLIDNDEDLLNQLCQLYSLWIANNNKGDGLLIPIEDLDSEVIDPQ